MVDVQGHMQMQYLHYTSLAMETLIGPKGKTQQNMQSVNLALVKKYAGKDANCKLPIYQKLCCLWKYLLLLNKKVSR